MPLKACERRVRNSRNSDSMVAATARQHQGQQVRQQRSDGCQRECNSEISSSMKNQRGDLETSHSEFWVVEPATSATAAATLTTARRAVARTDAATATTGAVTAVAEAKTMSSTANKTFENCGWGQGRRSPTGHASVTPGRRRHGSPCEGKLDERRQDGGGNALPMAGGGNAQPAPMQQTPLS